MLSSRHPISRSLALATMVFVVDCACSGGALAQEPGVPQVRVATATPSSQAARTAPAPAGAPSPRAIYPWKTHVTTTVFWIGEAPSGRNTTPNYKSSWDVSWKENFGGFDDPDPANRIANHTTGEFRPKAFIPKLNPFYIALPYNDVEGFGKHKPEASRVIPWFTRMRPEPGKTVCKGRWVQIFRNGRSCFAQWEDCGPWVTDDWEYVFGNNPPKNKENGSAGIDLSPAIRDYLGLKSGEKVHWRFVETAQVPAGPWKKYGPIGEPALPEIDAQRRYIENLRKLRDQEFMKKPIRDL